MDNLGTGFFVAMLLYTWQVFADYMKFSPSERFRKWVRGFGIFFAAFFFVSSIFGTVHILEIVPTDTPDKYLLTIQHFVVFSGVSFNFMWFWVALGSTSVTCGLDWIAETREKKVLRELNQSTVTP